MANTTREKYFSLDNPKITETMDFINGNLKKIRLQYIKIEDAKPDFEIIAKNQLHYEKIIDGKKFSSSFKAKCRKKDIGIFIEIAKKANPVIFSGDFDFSIK